MNTSKWLKILNPVLFVSFLSQAITGSLLFIGVNIEFIAELHEYNGMLLVFLVLTHITLNWNWIRVNFFKR